MVKEESKCPQGEPVKPCPIKKGEDFTKVLKRCDKQDIVVKSVTGTSLPLATDRKRATFVNACECRTKRNAEVKNRKEVCVSSKTGRVEPMIPVKQLGIPCGEFGNFDKVSCKVLENSRTVDPIQEPHDLGSDPTGHFVQQSSVYKGLFYTFHKARPKIKNKMDNMVSLSTNPFDNPFCMYMNTAGCNQRACLSPHPFICGDCYSVRSMSRQSGPRWRYNQNTALLANSLICENNMPDLEIGEAIRFNAEGELINSTHLVNLINIASYNPRSVCTLYTKRWDILKDVILDCGYKTPKNFVVIYSNPYVDYPITFDGAEYEFHHMPARSQYPLVPPASFLQSGIVNSIFNVVDQMPREEAHAFLEARITGTERIQRCHLNCFECKACYPRQGADVRPFLVVEEIKRL